jgi:hypothetical protein
MKFALLAIAAASAFVVYKNRTFRIKMARRSQRLRVVVEQAARGHINDRVVDMMTYAITAGYIEKYIVDADVVTRAGLELARHGTPESCLLAMYISNFTGVQYPDSTSEIIREAACHFKSTDDPRTVNIVQGKYLFEDSTQNQ